MAGRIILFFLIFALVPFNAGAQKEEAFDGVSYYLEIIDEEICFFQRLSWGHDANDYYYEVIIEEEYEDGFWREIIRENRTENFIEVSLPPGNYRYMVLVYNLLDQNEYRMDYYPFEILLALEPEIVSVDPHVFYLDGKPPWVLILDCKNAVEGAEVYLQKGNRKVTPRETEVNSEGSGIRAVFVYKDLDKGTYSIHVKNPGGLESSLEPGFSISFQDPLDMNLSLGYAPLFSLYGELHEFLGGNQIIPLGFIARFSVIPLKQKWGFLGVEVAPSWNYLSVHIGKYKVRAQIISVQFHGLYQYWFLRWFLALNVRIGAGFSSYLNLNVYYDRGASESISALMASADAGVSVQWVFIKPWFLEAGVDYIHFFSSDNAHPGYLRPSITVGRQF